MEDVAGDALGLEVVALEDVARSQLASLEFVGVVARNLDGGGACVTLRVPLDRET